MKWISVKDCVKNHPKYAEYVWGFWKNREVAIVCHYLSDKEIANGDLEQGIWYSADHEKLACISHWMSIERPEPPNEVD